MQYTLKDHGFTLLRGVYNDRNLAAVRAILVEAINGEKNTAYDPFERFYLRHRIDQGVLYDVFQRHPEFSEFVRNDTVLDCLETVLGQNILLYENSVVYKPKGKKNGVPFHQDFMSRQHEPRKFIAWTALEDIRKDSGALKVLPGSHKNGFLPFVRIKGETHHDRLDQNSLDTSLAVHVDMEPGDVLIFDQLLVHGSDEMSTDNMRFAFRASYQSFDEIFVPRGSPIAVRRGDSKSLPAHFFGADPDAKKNFVVRFLNGVGRKLARI